MSPEDLRACYLEHHKPFYLAALAITLERQAAEDAVHDALERMLTRKRAPANLPAYVMRAVRNAAIDAARRRRRMRTRTQTAEDVLVASSDEPAGISPRTLTAAFTRLGRDEREVILLHVYGDLSFREIAASRRRSINTVTSWYRRGIDRLRLILETNNGRD